MKVQFWERYRGRKDTFGVSVDFINAINNGRMKVADLQVSVRELTAGKRPYRLQNIHLQYGGRHELQSHTEKLKSSAVAVSLEPGNSYTLYYSYSFEGNAKPAKRFIVTVESTYENDGKPGYLKDSIAFKRQHYFYTN